MLLALLICPLTSPSSTLFTSVHRDLKPSNVLIVTNPRSGEARLVVGDFGLSRPLPEGRNEATNSLGGVFIPHFIGRPVVAATSKSSLGLQETVLGCVNLAETNLEQIADSNSISKAPNEQMKPSSIGVSVQYSLDASQSEEVVCSATNSDKTSAFQAFGTLGWMAPELCHPEANTLVSQPLWIFFLFAFFLHAL
ncbi:unnamed protein product [Protopolystoma xenopodis]|uniref:Protein kinase domain-containing protein n=1 Tax=Protopolystoma xenopodis TaxID=117903 RepID=A0A448WEM7_9PLAT|nr:unnamed protein product [Protopolystoma xenopodis]